MGSVAPFAAQSAPLPAHLERLLTPRLESATQRLTSLFPPAATGFVPGRAAAFRGAGNPSAGLAAEIGGVAYPKLCRPHLLLHGAGGNGQARRARTEGQL